MNYEDQFRATGRSTRRALIYIIQAMTNPGGVVNVRDHWGTHDSDVNLVLRCQELVDGMKLEGFVFNKSARTITCNFERMS